MPAPTYVRTTFYTEEGREDGPALFRLEAWPLPQDVATQIFREAEVLVKQRLREAGWDGQETDLTAKGPMQ